MLFVGIDIAKRNHEASVIAQDGRVVCKAMRFANSQAGYNKFVDMIRSLNEPVGMEATGHYWLLCFQVSLCHHLSTIFLAFIQLGIYQIAIPICLQKRINLSFSTIQKAKSEIISVNKIQMRPKELRQTIIAMILHKTLYLRLH